MHQNLRISKSILAGITGVVGLLGFYFSVLIGLSGREFALSQFTSFWPFVISLAFGFGVQIGLYTYLRSAMQELHGSGKVLAVSGTTSTAAMISCCSHYLANILPVIGVAGFITLLSQYQVELFWFGLASNMVGIIYMANKVIEFSRAQ